MKILSALNKIYIPIYIVIFILVASNILFIYKYEVANDNILVLNLENSNLENKLFPANTSDKPNVNTTDNPDPIKLWKILPKKKLLENSKKLTEILDAREEKRNRKVALDKGGENPKPRNLKNNPYYVSPEEVKQKQLRRAALDKGDEILKAKDSNKTYTDNQKIQAYDKFIGIRNDEIKEYQQLAINTVEEVKQLNENFADNPHNNIFDIISYIEITKKTYPEQFAKQQTTETIAENPNPRKSIFVSLAEIEQKKQRRAALEKGDDILKSDNPNKTFTDKQKLNAYNSFVEIRRTELIQDCQKKAIETVDNFRQLGEMKER